MRIYQTHLIYLFLGLLNSRFDVGLRSDYVNHIIICIFVGTKSKHFDLLPLFVVCIGLKRNQNEFDEQTCADFLKLC